MASRLDLRDREREREAGRMREEDRESVGEGDQEENIAEIAGLKGEMSTGGWEEGSPGAGGVKVRDRVNRARMPI